MSSNILVCIGHQVHLLELLTTSNEHKKHIISNFTHTQLLVTMLALKVFIKTCANQNKERTSSTYYLLSRSHQQSSIL